MSPYLKINQFPILSDEEEKNLLSIGLKMVIQKTKACH